MGTTNARIKSKRDTTANWNNARGFIPLEGEIIIYTDYKTVTENVNGDNIITLVPGIKVGDGHAYVQDLPFVDKELRQELLTHIQDANAHVTAAEKTFWNNKLNVNDYSEVIEGELIFNRS